MNRTRFVNVTAKEFLEDREKATIQNETVEIGSIYIKIGYYRPAQVVEKGYNALESCTLLYNVDGLPKQDSLEFIFSFSCEHGWEIQNVKLSEDF